MKRSLKSLVSRLRSVSLVIGIWSLVIAPASAQVPQLINYQGRLLNGTNLVNGNVGLSLRLFVLPSGGASIYEDSNSVAVADGLYSTFLGDNSVSGTLTNALLETNLWIEVAVNGVALAPRERLVSAAYAVRAQQALVFTGSVLDSQLSANIARLNGTNQTFSGRVNFTSVSNTFTGNFAGNGVGVTNVSLESVMATPSQPNVIAWGRTNQNQTTVPATATGVVAIAGGNSHSLALRGDRTVIAWGFNGYGQTNVPATATGVVAIAAGGDHNLALRGDGTVIAWGRSIEGQTNVPTTATGVVAIAGGLAHSLARRADGTVIAWGYNNVGQTNVPASATGVVAIAGGGYHSLALRGDGTVVAWGFNDDGQTTVPAGATGVVGIAGGEYHSLALRGDGTVIAWGFNGFGQTNVPAIATGVVAIAGGGSHNLALRGDGTVVAWGRNFEGQTNVPATATGVVAIAGGGYHSLALRGARAPAQLARLDVATNVFAGTVAAAGFAGNGTGLTNVYSVRGISVDSNASIFINNPAQNTVDPSAGNSTIGGGSLNSIQTNADASFIGGGFGNSIQAGASESVLIGGHYNSIEAGAYQSVLGGGNANDIRANAYQSVLGGGSFNSIGRGSSYSFLGGGFENSIQSNATASVLGGGYGNSIQKFAEYAVLGGGDGNSIQAGAYEAFVGGGRSNSVTGPFGAVPGGRDNTAGQYGFAAGQRAKATHTGSFVWSDSQNADFGTTALNQFLIRANGGVGIGTMSPRTTLEVQGPAGAAVRVTGPGGGGTTVSLDLSTYNPGAGNPPTAQIKATDNNYSSDLDVLTKIPGNSTNGLVSRLHINSLDGHVGIGTTTPGERLTVVGSGSTSASAALSVFNSALGNLLWVRNDGNVGIGTITLNNKLEVAGSVGATAFNNTSDRNAKENFEPVDPNVILDKIASLSLSQWNFKDDPSVKHIGPMAQDFRAAFGLGPNDTSIATVDADGVALAAIQALKKQHDEQKVAKDAKIEALEQQNAELKKAFDELKAQVEALKAAAQ